MKPIQERHSGSSFQRQRELIERHSLMGEERIISKVAVGRINPREVVQLKVALNAIEPINEACATSDNEPLRKIAEQLNPCKLISEKIHKEIQNDPPIMLNRGDVIREGVDAELDELRDLSHSGKNYLADMQVRLSEETDIPSLKIAFNNVFGYYIEVRNTHKDKVPESWIRKQTLVSAERYITQELKEYEEKILGAEEKIQIIETRIFNELILSLMDYVPAVQLNSNLIAQLDCLHSFYRVALENKYVRPEINESDELDIRQGRHPVIEKQLPIGESYVANDVFLDSKSQQIIIVTGPNMSGKSALLRQTALIVLLAQIGSFVPAESAKIGVVDKILLGGSKDNISLGKVPYGGNERSGKHSEQSFTTKFGALMSWEGTSTYDGISIACYRGVYSRTSDRKSQKFLLRTITS